MNKAVKKLIKRRRLHKQSGVYSIEFAIVGGLFFLLLFAILEVGRLFFVWNVLTEASRRGARLATVCDFNQVDMLADSKMISAALFNNVALVPNLTPENLKVEYLQFNGSLATDFVEIDLVRAEIVNYQHQLIIPGLFLTIDSPSFATILPVESLGVTRWKYTQCLPSPAD